jgi:hypothetical protein
MFSQYLTVKLTLAAGSTTAVVACGDIERFHLALHAWGLAAEVTFSTWPERETDSVFPLMTGADVVKARIELSAPRAESLVAAGIVTTRSVVEHTLAVVDRPVRRREITIRFADAAQVLWRQHYPCELVADSSLGDVIEAHLMDGIDLDQSWSRLGMEHPLVCLPLGAGGVDAGGASFYDFIVWYVGEHAGALTYDHETHNYELSGAKPRSSGQPGLLPADDVGTARTAGSDFTRHEVRILDAQATAPQTVTLPNEDGVAGVRRDVLARPPNTDAFDDLETYQGSRLAASPKEVHLELELARFPSVTLHPGASVKTPTDAGWSSRTWPSNRTWRVFDLELEGKARATPGDESKLDSRVYLFGGRAHLELDTDPTQRLPSCVAPEYPIRAEACILAAGGEEDDRRWQVVEDDRVGGPVYTAKVTLWNAEIIVPFLPNQQPGQLFFPAYKNSTVLLALSLHAACLVRYLDWGPGVRLPQDGQGDHLLLGFSENTETSISHDYVDQKPKLLIKRWDYGDLQSIELTEGGLKLHVEEEEVSVSPSTTFDVTLDVELARGELSGKIGGSIAEVSTKFSGAAADLGGAIGGTSAEVQGELKATTQEVGGKIDEAKGKISDMRSGLSGGAAPVTAAALETKTELKAALE